MFDETVAEMLTIEYNTNIEQAFYICDQQRRVQWLIRASVLLTETTTTLADMDLTAMVKVL